MHDDSLNTDILIFDIEQAIQQGMVLEICGTQLPLNQLLTELDSNNNYLATENK
ncbi:hypothetical protein [Wolbachia endosymbiont of Cylisticus convexus]|uniref:hypothetical protein n=1 Tax=Wolbachia endosymbiont of Cylisticus convexus TaxID=118728 RepID=UPI0015D06BD3|nr:hypothetical protein [Wolbachia endosymbiont of Cylisticus convexus]